MSNCIVNLLVGQRAQGCLSATAHNVEYHLGSWVSSLECLANQRPIPEFISAADAFTVDSMAGRGGTSLFIDRLASGELICNGRG